MKQAKDLIFGAVAVQMGKVLRSDLMKAALEWADSEEGSLSSTLVQQGKLSDEDREIIEGMVAGAINSHQGDEGATLTAFGGESTLMLDYFGDTLQVDDDGEIVLGENLVHELTAEEVPAVPIHQGRYDGYEEHSA